MRVFLAHAKGEADDPHVAWLREQIPRDLPGATAVLSRDEHRQTFGALGGWDAWNRYVGAGVQTGGRATFAAYVVPREWVGRATAHIVAWALHARRPVVSWPPGAHQPARVVRVEAIPGSESYTHGWRIITG